MEVESFFCLSGDAGFLGDDLGAGNVVSSWMVDEVIEAIVWSEEEK